MRIEQGILTTVLFIGYLLLWHIKKKELLQSEGVDADVISKAQRPIQRYFGGIQKVMTAAVAIIIIIHVFFTDHIPLAEPAGPINSPFFIVIGFVIGLTGLAVCRIAQAAIGKSWRVGIDVSAKPGLVTGGIYRFVRNPTYTGLFILCAGVWFVNPTLLFSYWIMAFFIMMEFQVRCEEEYLEEQYGDAYKEYAARTKRYLPFIY